MFLKADLLKDTTKTLSAYGEAQTMQHPLDLMSSTLPQGRCPPQNLLICFSPNLNQAIEPMNIEMTVTNVLRISSIKTCVSYGYMDILENSYILIIVPEYNLYRLISDRSWYQPFCLTWMTCLLLLHCQMRHLERKRNKMNMLYEPQHVISNNVAFWHV